MIASRWTTAIQPVTERSRFLNRESRRSIRRPVSAMTGQVLMITASASSSRMDKGASLVFEDLF